MTFYNCWTIFLAFPLEKGENGRFPTCTNLQWQLIDFSYEFLMSNPNFKVIYSVWTQVNEASLDRKDVQDRKATQVGCHKKIKYTVHIDDKEKTKSVHLKDVNLNQWIIMLNYMWLLHSGYLYILHAACVVFQIS